MAQRPLDMEVVKKVREEVRKVGGEALIIEASTIVGAFGLMTCKYSNVLICSHSIRNIEMIGVFCLARDKNCLTLSL